MRTRRLAVPASFVMMIVITILVTIAGTAFASPSHGRPVAALPANATPTDPSPNLRAKRPPTVAFARSEALARRAVGSICSGCASATASAKSRGPAGYPMEAAHERHILAR